ncbi:major facilitator family transporter [Hyphomonas neptunium ATCC 15444]|uniref:Major facilitator family transporter n=1 Tax=Hyphomonas neptunium (strain ATCC 15444) TaxID=228405 RepID=Q0C2S2_HYPNA|nr:major facilitator family transporter [Hyphomonas neptunium ATCC 15444]
MSPLAGGHLATLSTLDMLISAATFSSLGIVLPHMVAELEWSWSQAGLGFTILGAACGGSSLFPTLVIRKLGVRIALILGGLLMALGLFTMSTVNNLLQYFIAAAICGVAYQMLGTIPSTFVISRHFKNRSTALGLYFTIGGFGNVIGPWMVMAVLSVEGQVWRDYWVYQSLLLLATGVAGGLIIGLDKRFSQPAERELQEPATPAKPEPALAAESTPAKPSRVYISPIDWGVKQAMRTPQYKILVAAYFANLMALVTVTSLSVGHLVERGVSSEVAGAMLSLEAFIAVLTRIAGGFLGERIDPRYLMVVSLAATSIGCAVLATSDSHSILLIYAIGTGIGFGLTALSCTVLMMNYFGQRHNLELFSSMCLVGAASALGPTIGGVIRDLTGNFVLMFLILSAVAAIVWVAVVMMRAPQTDETSGAESTGPNTAPDTGRDAPAIAERTA